MIVIDLSKREALGSNPKLIQQITFVGNLHCERNTTMFLIIEELKETILIFSQGMVRVL